MMVGIRRPLVYQLHAMTSWPYFAFACSPNRAEIVSMPPPAVNHSASAATTPTMIMALTAKPDLISRHHGQRENGDAGEGHQHGLGLAQLRVEPLDDGLQRHHTDSQWRDESEE